MPAVREPKRRSLLAAGDPWLKLFCAAWFLSGAICGTLALLPGYVGDVSHYKYWTRVITTDGIQTIYGGVYPETYAIYPPVTLYAYGIVGQIYQRLVVDPWETERMLTSVLLTFGIKSVAVVFHQILGGVIFLLVHEKYGMRAGAVVAAAYLLNPAVIFDVAYWGQPNAAHSLFIVLGIGLLLRGSYPRGWLAIGVAAMTKPQAWAVLPLFVAVAFRRRGFVSSMAGACVAGGGALIVLAPFILGGRLGDFLTLPGQIAGVMPVASANAHGLWWIVAGNPLPVVPDTTRVIGPFSYRALAVPLMLLVSFVTLWRYVTTPKASEYFLSAYMMFGWFCFTTQAHEDHAFLVLPLLMMASPAVCHARALVVAVSITLLLNMLLHDPELANVMMAVITPDELFRLQTLNAVGNLLIFSSWTTIHFLGRPFSGAEPDESAAAKAS